MGLELRGWTESWCEDLTTICLISDLNLRAICGGVRGSGRTMELWWWGREIPLAWPIQPHGRGEDGPSRLQGTLQDWDCPWPPCNRCVTPERRREKLLRLAYLASRQPPLFLSIPNVLASQLQSHRLGAVMPTTGLLSLHLRPKRVATR